MAKKEEKTLFSTYFLKGVELANWKISTLFFLKASLTGVFCFYKLLIFYILDEERRFSIKLATTVSAATEHFNV